MAKVTGIYPDELHVSGLIREQSLSARLGGDAHLSATLSGRIVLNDYVLTLLDAGSVKRIIAERSGEDAQILDLADGVGIAAAVLNDDYTLTLSFTDGTSYTTPSILGAKGDTPEVTARRTESGLQLYSDGALIGYLADGPKGDTPVITGMRQGGVTVLYADGAEIARIADGHSPVITASKADGITHIYADGVEIAAIADGRDIDPDAIKRYVDGEVAKKQDTIADLTAIRSGAEKGSTALQSVTADDVESALGYTPADKTDVLSLSTETRQTLNSQLFIGSPTQNINNAFTHVRKLSDFPDYQGRTVYGLSFAVGYTVKKSAYASIQFRTYDNEGKNALNEAVLRFSKDRLQIGNRQSSNVPAESDYQDIFYDTYETDKLNTTAHDLIGAINELHGRLESILPVEGVEF